MRIPDDLLKSVVFLARIISKGQIKEPVFVGTGFLISVPSINIKDRMYLYLVTAKHVAESLSRGDWIVRMNMKAGKYQDIPVAESHKWCFHPNEADSVDVAVTPMNNLTTVADIKFNPVSMLLSPEEIDDGNVGPGDEVFMVGLFSRIANQDTNLPIVRTGNISLINNKVKIPGVKISNRPVNSEVHLIEARSIGGLSGSPAFVRLTYTLDTEFTLWKTGQKEVVQCPIHGPIFLLGLVHGHWDIPVEDLDEVNFRVEKREQSVNLGIAVVVPAEKIRETLYQPGLVTLRQIFDQQPPNLQRTTTPD